MNLTKMRQLSDVWTQFTPPPYIDPLNIFLFFFSFWFRIIWETTVLDFAYIYAVCHTKVIDLKVSEFIEEVG